MSTLKNYAYVTTNSGTVEVVDINTYSIISSITVGQSPIDASLTLDGNYAYIANSGSNNVSVIDTNTNTVINTIPVGTGSDPTGITMTPNGNYAYVANYGGGNGSTVSVISLNTNTVVNTFSIPNGSPSKIAFTIDGAYAYITNMNENVYVVDTSTFAIVSTITGFSQAWGIAVTTNGKYMYVTDGNISIVYVIDILTNTIILKITVSTATESLYGIAMTHDGKYAYVASYQNSTVYKIDINTNTVIDNISVGTSPYAIAITPNDKYAYVTNQTNDLNIINVLNNTTNVVVLGYFTDGIAISQRQIIPNDLPLVKDSTFALDSSAQDIVTELSVVNSNLNDPSTATNLIGQSTAILTVLDNNITNSTTSTTLIGQSTSILTYLNSVRQVYQQLIAVAESDAQTITISNTNYSVVSIYASATADTTFKVDYSNDNTNWYNYYTTASTAGELLHIETTTAGVLYVRLSSTAAGGTADTVTLILSSK